MKALAVGLALAVPAAPLFAQDKAADENIFHISLEDPEMAEAIRTAQAGLEDFFKRLDAPEPDDNRFSVEFNLDPEGDGEFIWATALRYDGNDLTGILASAPLTKGYEFGQRVTIPKARIIDWSYYRGTVAQGHATTRVILKRMSPEQAAKFLAALGWPQE